MWKYLDKYPLHTGIIVLLIYVKGIIITWYDSDGIGLSFHLNDLGPLIYFLGLGVYTIEKESF